MPTSDMRRLQAEDDLARDQDIDATFTLMQREIDNLRAEVKDQAARLVQLRPQTSAPPVVAVVPPWASTFERRLDIIAAEVARLSLRKGA